LSLRSDQEGASESQVAAFGMAVVSDQAIAVGVTAVPTPTTDTGSDLFYVYEWLLARFQPTEGPAYSERVVDSKAMRKVEDGQDVAIVMETGTNTSGVLLAGFVRMLIKIH